MAFIFEDVEKKGLMRGGFKLFLYDPRYNLKTKTDYETLSEMFEMNKNDIYCAKCKMLKIKKIWYLIEENTPLAVIKGLYKKQSFVNETWKIICGSGDEYLISNYGRIKRIYKNNPEGKLLLPYFKSTPGKVKSDRDRKQYIKVKFRGVKGEFLISRLVAYHFIDIYEEGSSKERYKNYKFDDVVVYHKNGILYDNYHCNLEFLDREDLGKKTAYMSKGGRVIVAIDAETNEIVGYFKSTRHVESILPVSKQSVCDSLNNKWKSNAVGGKYIFKYEED